MTPLYGRAPAGQRVEDDVPGDHWGATTLVVAERLDGVCAAMALPGPLDEAGFRVQAERLQLPKLRPGDIVLWDNLKAHQNAKPEELLERAGATLRPLPPYRPGLNPIEPMREARSRCSCAGPRRVAPGR